MPDNTLSLRGAITAVVVGLLLVVALVIAARALAPEPSRPPHVARPAADATQEQPTVTLTALEAHMHTFLTTLTTPPTTTTIPPAPTQPMLGDERTPLDNPDGFLACVRARESGGDYTIHELSGASQAAGAYQFLPSTWDSTATAIGRFDLVGIDPAAASPADQDAMAHALYAMQGMAPWGGGC